MQNSAVTRQAVHLAVDSSAGVAFPVVPVVVHSGQAAVHTLALLDTGSTKTFCDLALIKELGLDSSIENLDLQILQGSKSVKVMKVSLQITGKKRALVFLHEVCGINEFPNFHSTGTADVKTWSHMSNLDLQCSGSVKLLIGQDNPHLLIWSRQ